MAEQQPQEGDEDLKIPYFPPPPPFFQHFTAENKTRLEDIEKDAGLDTLTEDGSSAKLSAEKILALPTELRYLIPPEPPLDTEEFKVFGDATRLRGGDKFTKTMEWMSHTLAVSKTLVGWEYDQLYPFLRSILIAYIELLGIVAVNPTSEQKDNKLKDILTMVTNMHALINEYRPHQARETLIREMERQVERKKKEIEGVRKMKERVGEVLEGFGKEVPGEKPEDTSDDTTMVDEEDRKGRAHKQMWQNMDELLGQ
jgi:mediator of RNA polymerase II transcription subunit 7